MRIVADTNVLVSAAIKPHGRFATQLRQGAFHRNIPIVSVADLAPTLATATGNDQTE
jgi:predicted nucleic acid-binding protein